MVQSLEESRFAFLIRVDTRACFFVDGNNLADRGGD